MDRFFLNLKMERVWQRDYANHAEAMSDMADYIVGFYNSVLLHSTLGNLPPGALEQQSATHQLIEVSEKNSPGQNEVEDSMRSFESPDGVEVPGECRIGAATKGSCSHG